MKWRRADLLWIALAAGCGMSEGGFPDDDSGGDADTDADTDADFDSDAGPGDGGAGEGSSATCGDEWDNDSDGLADCQDPGCVDLVDCCDTAATSLVQDTFDAALDLGTWKRFGDGTTEVRDSGLYPSGDESYESGVVTTAAYPIDGLIELSFTISLPCVQCSELIGIALTARNDYAQLSSVEPFAGVVLDGSGEQLEMMLLVNDAVEARQYVNGNVFDMRIEVHPDGSVKATDNEGLGLLLLGQSTVDPSVASAYVAVFGRGGQSGSVEEVKLMQGACASPSAVSRPSADPIFAAGTPRFAPSAVRSPSVSQIPGDPELEMLFTAVAPEGTTIGRATSIDRGVSWVTDPVDTPVLGLDDLPIGYTSPDDPALLVRDLLDHVAVVSVAALGDASTRGLVTFESNDGITWAPVSDTPMFDEDCHSVRHPSLIESETWDETAVYYTCESADGYGSIHRATTTDLVTWTVDTSSAFELDPGADDEIDGVASPSVLFRDGAWELWYEARSGVHRVLKYAASARGIQWTRWDGTVLSPGPAGSWDGLQVGDPSAVITGPTELRIFYTGLGPAGQGIGVVTHLLP